MAMHIEQKPRPHAAMSASSVICMQIAAEQVLIEPRDGNLVQLPSPERCLRLILTVGIIYLLASSPV